MLFHDRLCLVLFPDNFYKMKKINPILSISGKSLVKYMRQPQEQKL